MKKVLLATAVFSGAVLALEITGAGATFPYPLYSKWAFEYNKETGHKVNYQSIGSGGGIRQDYQQDRGLWSLRRTPNTRGGGKE
jgi:phosphate ABC transporter substrate-binding protein, PhoT family (TC 3.A.1.7.1)